MTQVAGSRNLDTMTKRTTTEPDLPDPVSVKVAAGEFNKSPRTILHWINAGKLRATKLGPGTASFVISRAEIDRLKQDQAA